MSNVKERQDINESDIKCEGGVKKKLRGEREIECECVGASEK